MALTTLMVACGGSCPRAEGEESAAAEAVAEEKKPAVQPHEDEPAEKEDHDEHVSTGDESRSASPSAESGPSETKPSAAEPQFPEHASVAQAMAAIPQGTERSNIDPETLVQPIQDPTLYEPCKLGTQHFKVKVAVWDGHAVGVDVTTTNKKLAECVDTRVRSVEWKKKVRSLNTVEYAL